MKRKLYRISNISSDLNEIKGKKNKIIKKFRHEEWKKNIESDYFLTFLISKTRSTIKTVED